MRCRLSLRAACLPPIYHGREVAVAFVQPAHHFSEVVSQTTILYHTTPPTVPIRWVLIRDPWGKLATQALLSTDLDAHPQLLIAWLVRRWQVEVTLREMRTHWASRLNATGLSVPSPAQPHPAGPLLPGHADGTPAL